MLIKSQKTLLRSFTTKKNINKNSKNNLFSLIQKTFLSKQTSTIQSTAYLLSFQKQASKAFSQNQKQTGSSSGGYKPAQYPAELYTTPIYDQENPEFSETYLNFVFSLNSEELNQTKTDVPKQCESIITLIKLFPSLSNKAAYSPKIDFLLDFLYQNVEKFSCFELIKIFHTLIEIKIGGCNLPIKLNFYIAAKMQQAKAQSFKQKSFSLEEFIHAFFNHFHFCAESGYSSRHILNGFLNILGSSGSGNHHLHIESLFANESNLNNIIYLIAVSVANVNEVDKSELTEKAFLAPDKDVISVSNMTVLLDLLTKTARNLEAFSNSSIEKSNSRNRLWKALKFLSAEGVQLPCALDDFLAKYDASQISKFESHEMLIRDVERPKKLGSILEKIGLNNFEKDKKIDFCAVDFFVEPGVCVNINHEEDFCNDLLKGRVNLANRFLYLQNYDVINLPFFVFRDEAKIEELCKRRFYHIVNEGYDRLNADKSGANSNKI